VLDLGAADEPARDYVGDFGDRRDRAHGCTSAKPRV
jgi:hypothetical protein